MPATTAAASCAEFYRLRIPAIRLLCAIALVPREICFCMAACKCRGDLRTFAGVAPHFFLSTFQNMPSMNSGQRIDRAVSASTAAASGMCLCMCVLVRVRACICICMFVVAGNADPNQLITIKFKTTACKNERKLYKRFV